MFMFLRFVMKKESESPGVREQGTKTDRQTDSWTDRTDR